MPVIPMTRELRETIGDFAEKVSNRSLLLDKFVLPKKDADGEKFDDASRLSLLRIAHDGPAQLTKDAEKADTELTSAQRNQNYEKAAKAETRAALARALAATKCDSKDADDIRQKHSLRLLTLVRQSFGDRASVLVATLEGRLAINLATGLVQNGGIALDRLSGAPVIPGSAVKGIARKAAVAELRDTADADKPALLSRFAAVFGTVEDDFATEMFKPLAGTSAAVNRQGAVTFFPAYPVNEAKVVVDLTNVHYPDYYQTGRPESLRNEQPQPNPFPAVERGASFGFALALNGTAGPVPPAECLACARRWLVAGLTIHGLGAKTAAGYGWFKLDDALCEKLLYAGLAQAQKARAEAEAAMLKAEAARVEAEKLASAGPIERAMIEFSKLADEAFATTAKSLASKSSDEQLAFLRVLLESKDKREKLKSWRKKENEQAKVILSLAAKPEIKAVLDPLAKRLNLQFP